MKNPVVPGLNTSGRIEGFLRGDKQLGFIPPQGFVVEKP
jgi:hypothetical protein